MSPSFLAPTHAAVDGMGMSSFPARKVLKAEDDFSAVAAAPVLSLQQTPLWTIWECHHLPP